MALYKANDPSIAASLITGQVYVETFRYSDLLPNEPVSLIYSYRVTTRDSLTPLGVFRFGDETERIFAQLTEKDDWLVILLLDHDGTVIASSEEACHIPIGARIERALDADWRLARFAGREYLATIQATKGYQGYMGPGWYGHMMAPQHAFGKDASNVLRQVAPDALARVLSNPSLFSEGLRNIPLQAEQIQRELNRSVWNGNVRQSSDRKALNPAFPKCCCGRSAIPD